jgi:cell division inhibitor SepF
LGMMNGFMKLIGLQDEDEGLIRHAEHDREAEYDSENETNAYDARNKSKANIVSIHSQKSSRVVLYEPRSFDDAQEIADHLRSRRAVIVNLQRVRSEIAMRIVDFLSGTVYALNGSISKVGGNIFLCTPESVEIQGSISELLQE